MRISSITAYEVRIPFRRPFGHALQWRRETQTIIVCIGSETGQTGFGEILPRPYLTGETIVSVLSHELPELARRWRGAVFENRDQVVLALRQELRRGSKALATLAGWELAVLDLAGQTFQFSVADILGDNVGPELEAGVVIGFEVPTENLEKHCLLLRVTGRRFVKAKIGRNDDLQRLEIMNEVLGPKVPIRIDANGAWMADAAISRLQPMRRRNVCSVEQPVHAADLEGMRKVREKTGLSVVADESVCSLQDAHAIIEAKAADIFNIRIGKCGGLLASLDLVTLARSSGLSCQLGTLVGETGILSRASEIFGERVQGFRFLEGKHQHKQLLKEDIVDEQRIENETIHGLGIRVMGNNLARWTRFQSQIQ